MQIRRVVFCLLIGASLVKAQMAGNPAGVKGQGEWTVTAIGNYMNQQIGNEMAVSKRILLKSTWGVTQWFDVFGMLGGVQLDLKSSRVDVVDYEGKYRFGYGAGFNLGFNPTPESNFKIWLGGQVLRYPSEGSFIVLEESYTKKFEMNYDSREFIGYAGIIFPYKSVRFYVAGAGWAIQRIESKSEYLNYGGRMYFIGQVDQEYRSGLWTGGIVGIEFQLPQDYSINIEGLFFNEENYQVMVGISQTGGSMW